MTVLPLTKAADKQRRVYPFEVLLPAHRAGNPRDSIIMPHQIRTISRKRLLERIGRLSDQGTRMQVEDRLLDHLGIGMDDEE